jgi:hypothetical protein
MGGAGDLLQLSLNVPPWDDLHELTPAELRLTNLVTTDAVAEVLPRNDSVASSTPVAALQPKPVQDRFGSSASDDEPAAPVVKVTKTAEAVVPTGGVAAAMPAK